MNRYATIDATEMALLGAVMTYPDTLDGEATPTGITADDFSNPVHAVMWKIVLRVAADGVAPDALAVHEELVSDKSVRPPTMTHVFDCAGMAAAPGSVGYHARTVRKHGAKRRAFAAGQQIMQAAIAEDTDAADVAAIAEMVVSRIDVPVDDSTWSPVGDVMRAVQDRYAETVANRGQEGVRWGLIDVDKIMPPIAPGDFAVVVAWSGGGKSVLAANLALQAAVEQGKPALLHALEMTRVEVGQRYAAKTGSILLNKIIHGKLDPVEVDHLNWAAEKLDGAPLIVDEVETLTLSKLRASIRKHKPYLVVVDQIPIMIPEDSGVSREQQLTGIAYGLKRLAKAEKVAIVACAQLNSAPMSRSNKRPTLEDIRESRGIGQAANSVVALYDPCEGEKESPRAGEYEFIILKSRMGAKDTVVLAQQFHYSRLVDIAGDGS